MKTNKQITELLQSGDFTIAYHDNGVCSLYKGKFDYEDLNKAKEFSSYDQCSEGYIPDVVEELVKALNGKVESI